MEAAALAVNGMKPREANVMGWIHFGDLHLTTADQQNYLDLLQLIQEANRYLADELQFAMLPGDNAEHGVATEYELVRKAFDTLKMPLFAIAGDHDFHSGSLDLFRHYLGPQPRYGFSVGDYRFLFLNAMEGATHKEFAHSEGQIAWVREELEHARSAGQEVIAFLHCYPSEVAIGGDALSALITGFGVRLVEMGHTHYNELANDGTTIYATTRSTGQVEEGPVGFSITMLDRGVVSWKFHPLGVWPFAMITSPAEAALKTKHDNSMGREQIVVRARCWGVAAVAKATATLGAKESAAMSWDEADRVWTGVLRTSELEDGMYRLQVDFSLVDGSSAMDWIELRIGEDPSRVAASSSSSIHLKDKDYAIAARPDKGLLGTQLGPNKNGRKW